MTDPTPDDPRPAPLGSDAERPVSSLRGFAGGGYGPEATPPVVERPPGIPPVDPRLAAVSPEPPAFVDAWPGDEPVHLTGWAERNRFHPVLLGAIVFVLAWILFQVIGGVAVAAGMAGDILAGETPADPIDLIADNAALFLSGNALGQVLAFGLIAWLATRLSTRQRSAFLRIRRPDGVGLGLAALGWAAIYPLVLVLGDLNARLPIPDWLEASEAMRTDLIERLLLGGGLTTPFLLLTVALTPALFEELLFRGYLHRQVERSFGAWAAIVGVGVAFGLYHMSVTQALPLSVLGVYLGFVVWATGSLWTGVVVHLLNNGTAVLIAGAARDNPALNVESIEAMGVPWYLALLVAVTGALGVLAVGRVLLARRDAATGGRPDTAEVPLSSLPAPAAVPS